MYVNSEYRVYTASELYQKIERALTKRGYRQRVQTRRSCGYEPTTRIKFVFDTSPYYEITPEEEIEYWYKKVETYVASRGYYTSITVTHNKHKNHEASPEYDRYMIYLVM